ncbi:MAG TPA: hypothetical protein VF590_01480 [Isosphaeraceae bacterium]|jgi:hypothetical protein
MEGRAERGTEGVTLLDGAALVTGAAVASVHIRQAIADGHLLGPGWALAWLTFAGVALTASGPFVFLLRRLGRRPAGYPRIGDRLWLLLGLPWVLTAPLPGSPPSEATPRGADLYAFSLTLGLGAVCLVALAVIWHTWVMVAPEVLARAEPSPWTDRVGRVLAVAWPLQCGFGLVVIGG